MGEDHVIFIWACNLYYICMSLICFIFILHLTAGRLNIGFTTRAELNRLLNVGDVTAQFMEKFHGAALAFLSKAVEYAFKKLPHCLSMPSLLMSGRNVTWMMPFTLLRSEIYIVFSDFCLSSMIKITQILY